MQFYSADLNLIISKSSLFLDKLYFIRNSIFIVGGDTFLRVLDKKYYKDDEQYNNLINSFEKS